ncbi:hypothetical protein [Methanoregula sp.]|uniref:hypothetical protein n=1 Tax=Methanoregula sp. TaxID=2052170 RepID=UPI0035636250
MKRTTEYYLEDHVIPEVFEVSSSRTFTIDFLLVSENFCNIYRYLQIDWYRRPKRFCKLLENFQVLKIERDMNESPSRDPDGAGQNRHCLREPKLPEYCSAGPGPGLRLFQTRGNVMEKKTRASITGVPACLIRPHPWF